MINKVNTLVQTLVNEAWNYINNSQNKYDNLDNLGKIGISLLDLKKYVQLQSINVVEVEYIINSIVDRMCSYESLFYYTSFYNIPKAVYNNNPEEYSVIFKKTNIDITGFRLRIAASEMFNFPLNTSEDDYFFSRGNDIIRGYKNALKFNKYEMLVPLIYILLNYYQTLVEYRECKDGEHKSDCNELLNACIDLFRDTYSRQKCKELIQDNPQLSFFWQSQTSIYGFEVNLDIDSLFNNSIGIKELWALISLYDIDTKLFLRILDSKTDVLGSNYRYLNKADLQFKILVRYLSATNNKIINQILDIPIIEDINKCNYGPDHFFKNYKSINDMVTPDDLDILYSYNDGQLRQKVASIMINVDQNELIRQSTKPHGTMEISDIDVKFTVGFDIYYLSMPFKTAREIKKDSVPENIAYQIYKPFAHFGNHCIVIFITAKKCSQGLETYIQRFSIRQPKWKVYVIQEKQLASLLKVNGALNI